MPETNGRTLEEMDLVFKDLSSEAEEAQRRHIEADIIRRKEGATTATV